MNQHTPGPWTIDASVRTAINAGDKHVALANFYNSADPARNVSGEEHEANARLIAAAPGLLAALEYCLAEGVFRNPKVERIALAAIAKATQP